MYPTVHFPSVPDFERCPCRNRIYNRIFSACPTSTAGGFRHTKGPSNVQICSLDWCGRYDYRNGRYIPLHRHTFLQMFFIIEGTGDFQLHEASEIVPVKRGQIYLLLPNVYHGLQTYPNSEVKTMDLKFQIQAPSLVDKLKTLPLPYLSNEDVVREVEGLLERIHLEARNKPIGYEYMSNAYLLQVLLLCVRAHNGKCIVNSGTDGNSHPDEAESELYPEESQVKAYIYQNADRKISLEEIAERFNLSLRALHGRFKRAFGLSPHAYQIRCRIERAATLICHSELPFKQIADEVGFSSLPQFNRTFKKYMKTTPGNFRKNRRQFIQRGLSLSPEFVNVEYRLDAERLRSQES